MYDVCIIGGGASGMSAAITIAMENPEIKVVVLEKKDYICSKVKAAGNGRCNISNVRATTFGDSVKFFRKIGVEIKPDEKGWAYPVSERGEDVVYAFNRAAIAYGIEVRREFDVTEVKKTKENFQIIGINKKTSKEKTISAKKVIISSGGKSHPEFGTTGDSYKFVKQLGHSVNKIRPALSAIECEPIFLGCNGIRVKGEARLLLKSTVQGCEEGEIQFTDYGLTGICIFNLSRQIILEDDLKFTDYSIRLNLLNRYRPQEIFLILDIRKEIKNLETKDLMLSIVNCNIAQRLLEPWSNVKRNACDLTDKDLWDIIYKFMNIEFKVTGIKGWKKAQITSGGVNFNEFNYETMESYKCSGLYLTGEVIDLDGPCGGYNLENAWNTGRKAGKALCTELSK